MDEQLDFQLPREPEAIVYNRSRGPEFAANADRLSLNWNTVQLNARGQWIAVAGCELFVGESKESAEKMARTAHPSDPAIIVLKVNLLSPIEELRQRRRLTAAANNPVKEHTIHWPAE